MLQAEGLGKLWVLVPAAVSLGVSLGLAWKCAQSHALHGLAALSVSVLLLAAALVVDSSDPTTALFRCVPVPWLPACCDTHAVLRARGLVHGGVGARAGPAAGSIDNERHCCVP